MYVDPIRPSQTVIFADPRPDNQVDGSVWTNIEPSIAILVACLPIMRPLLSPIKFWRLRTGAHESIDYEFQSETSEQDPRKKYATNADEVSPSAFER